MKAHMDYSAFDMKKTDEYAARAKASWGNTPEYREFEQKSKGRTKAEAFELNEQMTGIFAEFGKIKSGNPASEKAQALVRKLQEFISEHFYTCPDETLYGLGMMYAGGGEMTENINRYGGKGTADFASEAIKCFCSK